MLTFILCLHKERSGMLGNGLSVNGSTVYAVTQRLVTTKESALRPLPAGFPAFPYHHHDDFCALNPCRVFYSGLPASVILPPPLLNPNQHPKTRKQLGCRGLCPLEAAITHLNAARLLFFNVWPDVCQKVHILSCCCLRCGREQVNRPVWAPPGFRGRQQRGRVGLFGKATDGGGYTLSSS